MNNVELFNEDCFVTMNRLVELNRTVDLILTSPPYNTGRNIHTETSLKTHIARYDVYCENRDNDSYSQWCCDLFNKYDSILSENGVVLWNVSYGSENPTVLFQSIYEIIRDTNFEIADVICWKKKSALPNNVSPNKLTRLCEFVFVFCRKSEYDSFRMNKKEITPII